MHTVYHIDGVFFPLVDKETDGILSCHFNDTLLDHQPDT